ncbi:MAG: phosphatidylglycerol lysyltransferase domain-containing protein [Planctomycetaceae bacterium]
MRTSPSRNFSLANEWKPSPAGNSLKRETRVTLRFLVTMPALSPESQRQSHASRTGYSDRRGRGQETVKDIETIKRLVRTNGRTATAFRASSKRLSWWADGQRGGVAYKAVRGAWVAAGEPVAAAHDMIATAERFRAAAEEAGKRAVFFATEGGLAHAPGFRRLTIGEQPYWHPAGWAAKVAAHRSLKEQLRRARAKGVQIRESLDPREREAARAGHGPLAALLARWVATRPMATMHFLVHPEPFDAPCERRLLVAERAGVIVGLLSLAPMGHSGWLAEHLIRAPDAPNGTAELMVDAAMRLVASEGATSVSLGLAPLGGNPTWWLRIARTASRPLFNFVGLGQFKRKLRPDEWLPIYLVYPAPQNAISALVDALRAFADGSLAMFALRTVLRGPRWVLRLLEHLLIPWTLLLACVPTASWFPSAEVHAAWVGFDAFLWGLLRLRRRTGHPRLTWLAACATSLDVALTTWQVAAWNAPRASGIASATVLTIAIAGPTLATLVLWGAVRRESHSAR